ncbi:cryptochrome/photolyase family protein [Thermomonas fusca]
MTCLRLVLGDQLDPRHPWFDAASPDVLYVLMEVRQETDYVLHHAQKILAIFAAMRRFADRLRATGHRVVYLQIDDPDNLPSLTANLDRLMAQHGATAFEYQAPDEWRLDEQLRDYAADLEIPARCVDSAHFLTARDEVARFFGTRKRWTMELFYRHMRQQHGILLEPDGGPLGGRWNFDAENRKPWRGDPPEPPDLRPVHDHRALWASIEAAGVASFGDPSADAFRWPIGREEALGQLDAFVEHALPHFGDYQDALSSRAARLFHSMLSFALNVKMLSPAEVIARVEAEGRAGRAPLAAVEGYIRQILGWREYVRGVYWAGMPAYEASNAFGHNRPLPEWFWTGRTRMACVRSAIGQSLAHAHAHHIQRLMVIGNFALLAGLDPQALHRWYLGIYIDAFEWVELPNTVGMSQFADGGLLATKPYISSAAYLYRMGDHCGQCHYRRDAHTGPRGCPFNALYWDFLDRNGERLAGNPRLAMPYRQLARMPDARREALAERAMQVLADLDSL